MRMTGKIGNMVMVMVMVFCVGLQACASGEPVSPLARAMGAGQSKIEEGRVKGQTEADVVPGVYLKVRYNPARCDVPAFEVYAHERWTRVFLDVSPQLHENLQELERRSQVISVTSFLEASGKFSGRRRTESGVRFPVFMVSDLREASITDRGSGAGA